MRRLAMPVATPRPRITRWWRPARTEAALNEVSTGSAWKSIPTWFVYGDRDKNIPHQALSFMAERAHSKQTVVVKGASHVVMVSHPATVAKLIEDAAQASGSK